VIVLLLDFVDIYRHSQADAGGVGVGVIGAILNVRYT
jgi:hypothetical protein